MRQYSIILGGLMTAAACAPQKPELLDTTPIPTAEAPACADPYVEIINRTNKPIDVYQYVGGVPYLVGQATSSTTRLTLLGTAAERQPGALYAMSDGQRLSQAAGSAKNSGAVQLTRKC